MSARVPLPALALTATSAVCAAVAAVARPAGTAEGVDAFWSVLVGAWVLTAVLQVVLLVVRSTLKLGDFTLFGVNLLLGGGTCLMTIALAARLEGTRAVVVAGCAWMALLVLQLITSTGARSRAAARA